MSDTKKSQNRVKKEATVAQFAEKVGKANAIVLTNYQGLTHQQLESIKKAVKKLDAEFVVTKNTLLKLALESKDLRLTTNDSFDNPTAVLFTYGDVVLPLKVIAAKIKETQLPQIKIGILGNELITAEQVLKLSTLPSKEVLLGQLVGTLKSPIFGLHRALSWNLQSFVMTLQAISNKQQATS